MKDDILSIAKNLNLKDRNLILYGNNIAKIKYNKINKKGKLILVTAMTSNKSGIGKTTISIGLADALNYLNKKVCLSLREPSMGPVFGIKGGATGGGLCKVEPSNEINLNFTGDFYAIAQANNLLCSILDNHIFQGNTLKINTLKIFIKRCLDINDRSLREISYKIKNKTIKTGFNITAASEVMSIVSLSKNFNDLKYNLGNILVALDINNKPILAKDLKAEESMCIILKDAFKPNLVKTLNNTPALIHLGPFANISHGCSSVVATNMALSLADYCVTEAGFGSDLGAEKFLDIKTRIINKYPNAIVLVISINVIKEHGNGNLEKGFENVKKHIDNLKFFNIPFVVALNIHKEDNKKEINFICGLISKLNIEYSICNAYNKGFKGCINLANKLLNLCDNKNNLNYCYDIQNSIKEKIDKICKNIYGAKNVLYSKKALEKINLATNLGYSNFYVNIAKTQFSFSDNKNLLGAPTNFLFKVKDIEIRAGAKMIVVIAGDIVLMPGLSKNSNYLKMRIDDKEKITGLF